ncbi:hypothetical protein [Pedobacter sp. Leaf170]|uniref:hypothetical protein n=1 Tax=Pedobacter sp. Leaf170 TaxID=2876558 RepID=UPI001E46B32B|nr:hypothetical protein [Pedobacter sp. Leaf170]
MSIFEWLFEINNPGPTGDFETGHRRLNWPRIWILAAGLTSLLVVGFIIYIGPFNRFHYYELSNAMLITGLIIIYLCVSYYVYPKPNLDNMGFLGFIDNPFRYTDDINRFIIYSQILLFPGKVLAIPIVNLWFVFIAFKNEKNNIN